MAGTALSQTTGDRPPENSQPSPAPSETGAEPSFRVDPNAPLDQNSLPSLITMPGLSEMKAGASPSETGAQQTPNPPEAGQQRLPEFRIGAGDVLRVSVWREPEVSVDGVAVRSDGKISLPLIREIHALGLMPAELEAVLRREFSRYINGPDVTVIVKEINSQKVYLVGGVMRPGSILLRTPMTILQVLAEAGGLTDYAKRKRIYILRKDGDRESRIQFNYEAVLKGDSPEQNIPVLPGDTIVVPE
jgi:polysaccharide export outer membrane protein